MSQAGGFHGRKEQIVSSLVEYLDPERRDKSPKGFIDAPILDLMHVINSHPEYYTTSSCSGRVAMYCEGLEKDVESTDSDPNAIEKTTKGGQWLYVSHDPIPIPDNNSPTDEWIVKLLFGKESDKVVFDNKRPADILNRQLIYFKFEPLVSLIVIDNMFVLMRGLDPSY
ncbi:tRNA wybutosine-synthesizing protein [Mucor mucedo]|uniref:tRNA wybutosine-synthesizing protein n=1 Tax=Mucor mucedo TaxID=29922 RepID=UPI002220ED88|nr:tRNA wybutosine-synthesizing protein [Mucor mucedo]KAI7890937.1 tRNA wybutosine-synthesizing protein [Mucor mucedo]